VLALLQAEVRATSRRDSSSLTSSASMTGFSFFSNQHSLTVDTVLAFELVGADSSVRNVTLQSDPDQFWALKVGARRAPNRTENTVGMVRYDAP